MMRVEYLRPYSAKSPYSYCVMLGDVVIVAFNAGESASAYAFVAASVVSS